MRRSVPNWLTSSGWRAPCGPLEEERRPAGLHRPVDDLGDLEVRVDLGGDADELALALEQRDPRAQIGRRRHRAGGYLAALAPARAGGRVSSPSAITRDEDQADDQHPEDDVQPFLGGVSPASTRCTASIGASLTNARRAQPGLGRRRGASGLPRSASGSSSRASGCAPRSASGAAHAAVAVARRRRELRRRARSAAPGRTASAGRRRRSARARAA